MKNRIIAAAAAVALVMGTGCSSGGGNAGETKALKGGYAEENAFSFIYQGEGMTGEMPAVPLAGELLMSEGRVSFADQQNLRFYTETEDFRSFTNEVSDVKLKGDLAFVCRSEDGVIFAVRYDMDYDSGDTKNEEGIFILPDGSQVKLDTADVADLLGADYEFGSDGKLYISDRIGSSLIKADPDTGKTEVLCKSDGDSIDIVKKYAVTSSSYAGVTIYDTEKDETVTEQKALDDFWKEKITTSGRQDCDICAGEEGTMYIACSEGIFRYVIGGNTVEQLCSGVGKRLSETGDVNNPRYISSIVKESEDTFLVSYKDGIIKRYRYDPDYEEMTGSELKIYTFEQGQLTEKAISWYAKQHPEVYIKREVPDPSLTYEDKVKNLVTEIMSDDPPDVIFLDGLDIENLTEKDVLADLSESREKWYPEKDELFDNIVEWNKTDDGKLYSVAGGFAVPYIVSDGSEDISGIESFKDYADYVAKRTADDKDPMKYIPSAMNEDTAWKAYLFDINDMMESGVPDKGELTSLLESISCLSEKSVEELEKLYPDINSYGLDMLSMYGMSLDEDEKGNEYRFIYNSAGVTLLDGATPMMTGLVCNYQYDFDTLISVKKKYKDAQVRYGDEFLPVMNMGICSRSRKQEAAQEFIGAALSYLPQTGLTADGIPVNLHSLKDALSTDKAYGQPSLLGMGGQVSMGEGEEPLWFEYAYPTDEQLAEFIEVCRGLEKPIVYDRQTFDMVTKPITDYLNGRTTADEAAETIISGLGIKSKE